MSGLLNDNPLAELITEISDARLSGVLRVSQARAKGAVYFHNGEVVSVLTNLRAYRLVEVLGRSGAVASDKLDLAFRERAADDEASAELVASGAISAEELTRFRQRLATEILRQLLKWSEGDWAFDPRVRLGENQHLRLETRAPIVDSVRDLTIRYARRRFTDPTERLTPTRDVEISTGIALLPAEAFVLSRFDGASTLGEIVAISGLSDSDTISALYVLVVLGMLRRERPSRALSEKMVTQGKLASVAASRATAGRDAGVAEPPLAGTLSSVFPNASEPEPERDPKEELIELYERADRPTHYDVLGVTRASHAEEIKRAYYSLARRFHPDHFRRWTDESELQRVELCFAKIAQAYETLKEPKRRAPYDLKLSIGENQQFQGPAQNPTAQTPSTSSGTEDGLHRAEELFQEGLTALRRKDFSVAIRCLEEAVKFAPLQPRYRAYFGSALASNKSRRRQAESELQAAINLDPRNVTYRVMLAELYRDIGLRRKAESELLKALSIDKTHAVARRLLEDVRKAG